MIESFKVWLEDIGLADPNFVDRGAPKIRNKKIINKYKIPDISTWSYERSPGMARKVEGIKRIIPKYKYDVNKIASTKLDPG